MRKVSQILLGWASEICRTVGRQSLIQEQNSNNLKYINKIRTKSCFCLRAPHYFIKEPRVDVRVKKIELNLSQNNWLILYRPTIYAFTDVHAHKDTVEMWSVLFLSAATAWNVSKKAAVAKGETSCKSSLDF